MDETMKIGIIDFNTAIADDVTRSLNSLSSLIPEEAFYRIINFRNDHDFNQYDVLILTGSALSAFMFQEMLKNNQISGTDYICVNKVFTQLLEYEKPMFGICFGAQILALLKGGEIGRLEKTEMGFLKHKITEDGKKDTVFGFLPDNFYGAHLHDDYVSQLPQQLKVKSSCVIATRNNYIHAYKIICKNNAVCYGVQSHPEMSTPATATFMIKFNEEKIRRMIGDEAYEKIAVLSENVTFDLPEVIPNFFAKFAKVCPT